MTNIIKLLSIFMLITLVGCQYPLDSERQFEDKYSDETLTRIGNILDKNPKYECLTYKMWLHIIYLIVVEVYLVMFKFTGSKIKKWLIIRKSIIYLKITLTKTL